jgi:hypothetical protein
MAERVGGGHEVPRAGAHVQDAGREADELREARVEQGDPAVRVEHEQALAHMRERGLHGTLRQGRSGRRGRRRGRGSEGPGGGRKRMEARRIAGRGIARRSKQEDGLGRGAAQRAEHRLVRPGRHHDTREGHAGDPRGGGLPRGLVRVGAHDGIAPRREVVARGDPRGQHQQSVGGFGHGPIRRGK